MDTPEQNKEQSTTPEPAVTQQPEMFYPQKNLEGIGGWLLLLAILLPLWIINYLIILVGILIKYSESIGMMSHHYNNQDVIFGMSKLSTGFWMALVTIVFLIIMIVHFYKRSKKTPILFISFLVGQYFTSQFIYYSVILRYINDSGFFDLTGFSQLSSTIISAFIWIPYFLLSKRVKATFTR